MPIHDTTGDKPHSKPIRWKGVHRTAKRKEEWAIDVLNGVGVMSYVLHQMYSPYTDYIRELWYRPNPFWDTIKAYAPNEWNYIVPLNGLGKKRKRAWHRGKVT